MIRPPRGQDLSIDMSLKVKDIIDPTFGDWCHTCLRNFFNAEDVALVLKDKPNIRKEDRYIWSLNRSEHYSVKTGYWLSGKIKTEIYYLLLKQDLL